MALAVGIDLGTTKSVACVWRDGRAEIIPSAEGERWTPSVVAFTAQGNPLVGAAAKRQAIANPTATFWSFKHLFGVIDESAAVRGRHYAPGELAGHILSKIAADVSASTDEPLTQAVMTVPTMFGVAERAVLRRAAAGAGIDLVRILEEPVAASLAYGLTSGDRDTTVLTFDLGGGTLDAAVLEVGSGVYDVRSVAGDTRLGGDDWDRRIVDRLLGEFRVEHDVDLSADPVALQRLRDAAEQAKIDLTAATEATVLVPFIARTSKGSLTLERIVTRVELDAWTEDLLDRCRVVVEQALLNARTLADGTLGPPVSLDHVVLVGGASRIPAVTELVRAQTGLGPHHGINPDEVVAVGAARQAGILAGTVQDTLLLNVLPMSIGVELRGGSMMSLVPRNTTIPTKRAAVVTTAEDDVDLLVIHLAQGDREMALFDEPVAVLKVPLSPAAKGVAEVEVMVEVDANGIIRAEAFDRSKRERQGMTVTDESARLARQHRARADPRERERHLPADPRSPNTVVYQEEDDSVAAPADAVRRAHAEGAAQPHAFLSYSRADAEYALRLVGHLARAGIAVWWDGDVEPSDDWVLLLEERMRASIAVVAIMSPHAERSKWVRRELLFAQDIGKPILPLRLAGRRMLQLFELQDDDVRTGLMPSDRFMRRLATLVATG